MSRDANATTADTARKSEYRRAVAAMRAHYAQAEARLVAKNKADHDSWG